MRYVVGDNWFRDKSGKVHADERCLYPNCNCHFGYQEEGSDNCPNKRKDKNNGKA